MTIRLTLGALNAGQERAYLDRLRERYDGEVVALPGAAVLLDGLGELPWAIVTSGSRTTLPRRADGSDCRRGSGVDLEGFAPCQVCRLAGGVVNQAFDPHTGGHGYQRVV